MVRDRRKRPTRDAVACEFCWRARGVPPFTCPRCKTFNAGDDAGRPGRVWARAHMLSPEINALVRQVRRGDVKDLPASTTLGRTWDDRTRDALLVWLQTVPPQNLGYLLTRVPMLIAHPLVAGQIEHLVRLANPRVVVQTGAEPSANAWEVPARNIFRVARPRRPTGARPAVTAAQEHLARIITAWAKGLLPAWQVTLTPPVPRGRPAGLDVFQKLALAVHFRDLRVALGTLPLQGEGTALATAVAELSGRVTIEPIFGLYGPTLTAFPETVRDSVSPETALELVRLARSLPKAQPNEALAYALLASDLGRAPLSLDALRRIRGEVVQARRIWPQLKMQI